MIVDRVIRYLESVGADLDPALVDTAVEQIRASMVRNFGAAARAEDTDRRVRLPRPSGSWRCARQQVFNALALACPPYGWRSRLTFTHGDTNEAIGVLLFKQALAWLGEQDLLTSPSEIGKQDVLEATIDPAQWGVDGEPFTMKGHVDMTVRVRDDGKEGVVDWKAINRYAFQNMSAAAADSTHQWWVKEGGGYVAQVRWYMMLLRLMGRGCDWGALVGVCKDTGHLVEVRIPHSHEEEVLLVKKAVYTQRLIAEASERRAIVLQDTDGEGNADTDAVLAEWVNEYVPRPQWTHGMTVEKGPRTRLADGSNGACVELDTKADPRGFACNYCDHTARCWPGFQPVALSSGPVYRKPL